MARLIDADALGIGKAKRDTFMIPEYADGWNSAIDIIDNAPTVDAVEVVRCKDCIYYHKEHVLCNDGTEKDYSEFPAEAFGSLGRFVNAKYGINVAGKCEIELNSGYAEDKSIFRNPDDFCSRGKRKVSE